LSFFGRGWHKQGKCEKLLSIMYGINMVMII
jgi:hypothetical protein